MRLALVISLCIAAQPMLGKNAELAGGIWLVTDLIGSGYGACRRVSASSKLFMLAMYQAARGDVVREANAVHTRASGAVSSASPKAWRLVPDGTNSVAKSRKQLVHGLA